MIKILLTALLLLSACASQPPLAIGGAAGIPTIVKVIDYSKIKTLDDLKLVLSTLSLKQIQYPVADKETAKQLAPISKFFKTE